MTVAEIIMEDHELDDHFERLMSLVDQEDLISRGISDERELDWWLSEYPTLEEAESALLERSNRAKSLNKNQFPNLTDYLSECAKIDRETMMLEMTVDELYQDWMPDGANHSDFKIGTIFRAGGGRFLCTDVGQRTIVAIRYTPRNPDNMNGPPYFLVESVFDEYDIEGVTILSR